MILICKAQTTWRIHTQNKGWDKMNEVKMRYLNQVIKDENVVFSTNNLVISPAGSGKTTLIKDIMKVKIENCYLGSNKKFLLLVSTRALKEAYPSKFESKTDEEVEDEVIYGDYYDVMTYAKFGTLVIFDNIFLENVADIFCDAIHSLFQYFAISKSMSKVGLGSAIKVLTEKHSDREIYYFTATARKLYDFAEVHKGVMRNMKVVDYTNLADIKRNKQDKRKGYRTIEQIPYLLKPYIERIHSGEVKVLFYTKLVNKMKFIEQLLEEENAGRSADEPKLIPLVIWSKANKDHEMSKETLEAYDILMKTGQLISPYNCLIINEAAVEGWDLLDKTFQVAVIDTEDETSFIQSLGRIRQNIEEVFYLDANAEPDFEVMEALLDKPMSTNDRDILIRYLGLLNTKGGIMGWKGAKPIIEKHGYKVKKKEETVNKELVVSWVFSKA